MIVIKDKKTGKVRGVAMESICKKTSQRIFNKMLDKAKETEIVTKIKIV